MVKYEKVSKWQKKNMVKYEKVSKYYDHDYTFNDFQTFLNK